MSESGNHVVVGAGPVGRAVLDELISRGLPVRVVVRHQVVGLPAGVEVVRADVSDVDRARQAMAGASVVYHAASAPYDRWPELLPPLMRGVLAGAVASGARVTYADNPLCLRSGRWAADRGPSISRDGGQRSHPGDACR